MLILTRHPGQLITLQPHPSLRPATPIGRLSGVGNRRRGGRATQGAVAEGRS